MTVPYHSTTNMVVPHQMVPYQYGCAFMMAVPDLFSVLFCVPFYGMNKLFCKKMAVPDQ